MVFKQSRRSKIILLMLSPFYLAMLFLTIYSLYMGIGVHDESFYIGMSYSFILGNQPFVDEYNIIQMASLIIMPIIKAFVFLHGSTSGIVLFSRYLYFFASLLVSGIVLFTFRKFAPLWMALFLASVCIVFVPGNMHSLSYDTIAFLSLTTGFLFSLNACLIPLQDNIENANKRNLFVFLSGASLGITAVVYPTLVIITFFYGFVALWFLSDKKVLLYYYGGAFISSVWILPFLYHAGINQLMIDYYYAKSIGVNGGGIVKFKSIIYEFITFFPHRKLIFVLCALFVFSIGKFIWIRVPILLCITLAILVPLLNLPSHLGSFDFLVDMGFLCPIYYIVINNNKNPEVNKLFKCVWLPSVIAGCIISWTSSNGELVAIIGFFSGVLVTLYYMMLIINEVTEPFKNSAAVLLNLIIPVLILAGLQYLNIQFHYEDMPLSSLNYKMENGPFKGLFTTKENFDYFNQLANDLAQIVKPNRSIMFFDDFPAGYLFTTMIPNTNCIWLFSQNFFPTVNRQSTIEYYKNKHSQPTVIVKMLSAPGIFSQSFYIDKKDDPIVGMLSQYQLVLQRRQYEIYILN